MKKDLVFKAGGKPIKIVETFKHLGTVAAKNDNDEEAVKQDLGRRRGKWASMRRHGSLEGIERSAPMVGQQSMWAAIVVT
jgi:hypothetical protein